eukprot:TRINITY_DN16251_c0_g1_i1.p2 TRINITY_DN16251_c0_g1~~TRINITY_DN16251_c0_g1_i1.p2  ORF type:complete len:116 (+),score=14.30 TRINITY_DN16251_c0_g1_i1:16-363(+)
MRITMVKIMMMLVESTTVSNTLSVLLRIRNIESSLSTCVVASGDGRLSSRPERGNDVDVGGDRNDNGGGNGKPDHQIRKKKDAKGDEKAVFSFFASCFHNGQIECYNLEHGETSD